ncbi:Rieske 2Fe-2S domain-containing protein [Pseudomonas silvicola]|nr:Rieske 2Fe-2S domain-containing protein [Pseudomonas silvicola]
MLNLSMKPTGWFQIGWSAEIPPGGVKPIKYFGHEMVAFRNRQGVLSVLDAHCPHMGAHLGYGGKVEGDCIACPYHGWQWNLQGENMLIPGEERRIPKRLRKWHVVERHGLLLLWHDPAGGAPREGWDLPDLFDHPELPADVNDFYPCYPDAIVFKPDERIHPQLMTENAADTAHFRFTHGAPEDPVLLDFDTSTPVWQSQMGFFNKHTKEIALRLFARNAGVGLSFTIFDHGKLGRRLVLSCTPVDDDSSDLRVSYFFPRDPDSPHVMPEHIRELARQTEGLFEEDARMWRHQRFRQQPIFAKRDVLGYRALREWCKQFYEAEGCPRGPLIVMEDTM